MTPEPNEYPPIPEETHDSEYTTAPPQRTSKPIIAGILLIIAGISSLGLWITVYLNPTLVTANMPSQTEITVDQLLQTLQFCIILEFAFSILALAAGIVSLRRKAWPLACFGSAAGILTLGFSLSIFPTASICSLFAFVLILVSKREYT